MMQGDESGKTITTVYRATEVLSLFTKIPKPTLGVTEIAQALGLSKAVVHRILATLASKDYVQADEQTRRYSLGPAVLALGLTYLDRIDIRRMARASMQALSAVTNETATLSIRSGSTRVYVDQVTPPREVRMTVQLGQAFPLHAGSSSKVFLAFLPPEEREEYLASGDLRALTEATITDPATLREELARVRQRGYARSLGERQAGAASVAAPVLDHRGQPVAAISVCGPAERFSSQMDAAAGELLTATRELSLQLGHGRRTALGEA